MAKKELYRLDAFVFESEEIDKNGIALIVRNTADTWRMVFTDKHPLTYAWLQIIGEARGSLVARHTLEATFTMLFALSNIGIHDAKLTEELVKSLTAANERIALVIDHINAARTKDEAAADAADDKEWAERAERLEEMKNEQV